MAPCCASIYLLLPLLLVLTVLGAGASLEEADYASTNTTVTLLLTPPFPLHQQPRAKRELISTVIVPLSLELLRRKENREAIVNLVTNSTLHSQIKESLARGWHAVKSLWPWGGESKGSK